MPKATKDRKLWTAMIAHTLKRHGTKRRIWRHWGTQWQSMRLVNETLTPTRFFSLHEVVSFHPQKKHKRQIKFRNTRLIYAVDINVDVYNILDWFCWCATNEITAERDTSANSSTALAILLPQKKVHLLKKLCRIQIFSNRSDKIIKKQNIEILWKIMYEHQIKYFYEL